MASLAFALCSANPAASGVVIEITPQADTTLHEIAPGSNLGGHAHVAIGTTAKSTRSRGLFRFELAGKIPAEAVITSAELVFDLPGLNRPDTAAVRCGLHLMLRAWGEGNKAGDLGAAAETGEATWNERAKPDAWGEPGGQAGTDFASEASAESSLGPAPGAFTVASTSGLVADAQFWLANPAQNFGWLVKAVDEATAQTAKKYSSRESGFAPRLRIDYALKPAEFRVSSITRSGGNVVIEWAGPPAAAQLEFANPLPAATWQAGPTAANGSAFTNPITGPAQFFRLRAVP